MPTTPPYLWEPTTGNRAAYWTRFRHPMLGKIYRVSTSIQIADYKTALDLSNGLAELIKNKVWHRLDRYADALAQHPAAAKLFFEPLFAAHKQKRLESTQAFMALLSPQDCGKVSEFVQQKVERERDAALTEKSLLERKVQELEQQILANFPKLKPVTWTDAYGQYLAAGASTGGIDGRAWSPVHARQKKGRLKWWGERLKLDQMIEITDAYDKIQSGIKELRDAKKAEKTTKDYVDALSSFVSWCQRRDFLSKTFNLDAPKISGASTYHRDALTDEEVLELMAVTTPERAIVYEVAAVSGLRKGELMQLTVGHVVSGKLKLNAEWTKSRKEEWQLLPQNLFERLQAMSEGKEKTAPLMHVSPHVERWFNDDLEKAKIDKERPDGSKLFFHSLRHSNITAWYEVGASVPEAMKLGRHRSQKVSMRYAHTRDARLQELTEKVGARFQPTSVANFVANPEASE